MKSVIREIGTTAKSEPNKREVIYAHLFCEECETVWDISFSNTSESPGEYAMFIEQKINDGCPDDGGKLILVEPINKKGKS